MRKIVLASNNRGKIAEFQSLFSGLQMQIIPQGQLDISEAEEPFETFVENALAKARHASAASGLPAVADDSGLSVPALAGAPGVYSARYAMLNEAGQGDADNNTFLLKKMQNIADRKACFVCVLVYINSPTDPRPIIAEGLWWGEIAQAQSGDHGFGYDPLFFIPELNQSAAQLAPEQKNQYSHRAQALRLLMERLVSSPATSSFIATDK